MTGHILVDDISSDDDFSVIQRHDGIDRGIEERRAEGREPVARIHDGDGSRFRGIDDDCIGAAGKGDGETLRPLGSCVRADGNENQLWRAVPRRPSHGATGG